MLRRADCYGRYVCDDPRTGARAMSGSAAPVAVWLFVAVVFISLGATLIAARRGGGQDEFFTAGGRIGGVANGIAIYAEFTSAASLLAVIGLFYGFGGDAIIYLLSTCVGFAIVLFTMAERYRALGTVTIADVLTNRFRDRRLRTLAAVSSLVVVGFYLIAQLVSGAQLLCTLFDLNYELAVLAICTLVLLFVTIGGMLATTWVQMFKAGLFVCGLVTLSFAALAIVDFDFGQLLDRAAAGHQLGRYYMQPGAMLPDLGATLSLGMSLALGVARLPHILIRFCTVAVCRPSLPLPIMDYGRNRRSPAHSIFADRGRDNLLLIAPLPYGRGANEIARRAATPVLA